MRRWGENIFYYNFSVQTHEDKSIGAWSIFSLEIWCPKIQLQVHFRLWWLSSRMPQLAAIKPHTTRGQSAPYMPTETMVSLLFVGFKHSGQPIIASVSPVQWCLNQIPPHAPSSRYTLSPSKSPDPSSAAWLIGLGNGLPWLPESPSVGWCF